MSGPEGSTEMTRAARTGTMLITIRPTLMYFCFNLFLHSRIGSNYRAGVPPLTRALSRGRPKPLAKTWVQEDTPSRLVGYGVPPRRTCSFALNLVVSRERASPRGYAFFSSRLGRREHLRVRRSPFARCLYYIKISPQNAVIVNGTATYHDAIGQNQGSSSTSCNRTTPKVACKARRSKNPSLAGAGQAIDARCSMD